MLSLLIGVGAFLFTVQSAVKDILTRSTINSSAMEENYPCFKLIN